MEKNKKQKPVEDAKVNPQFLGEDAPKRRSEETAYDWEQPPTSVYDQEAADEVEEAVNQVLRGLREEQEEVATAYAAVDFAIGSASVGAKVQISLQREGVKAVLCTVEDDVIQVREIGHLEEHHVTVH